LPIAPRYLVAEMVLGSIFLLMAVVELIMGGWNLPFYPIPSSIGIESMLFEPHWDLVRQLVFHLILLSSLFTFALVKFENFPIPRTVLWLPLLIGILMILIWPELQPVSWHTMQRPSPSQFAPLIPIALANPLIGGSVGWLIALFLRRWGVDPNTTGSGLSQSGLGSGLLLIGVFLGWQAVFSTAIIFLAISVVSQLLVDFSSDPQTARPLTESRWNNSSRLFLATLIQLLLWRIQVSMLAG
jgi:hypothetical protein